LTLFKDIPDIPAAYKSFPGIRGDLRYILLWHYGSFYAKINARARMAMRGGAPIIEIVERGKNVS
jgi:hypothetical protein